MGGVAVVFALGLLKVYNRLDDLASSSSSSSSSSQIKVRGHMEIFLVSASRQKVAAGYK